MVDCDVGNDGDVRVIEEEASNTGSVGRRRGVGERGAWKGFVGEAREEGAGRAGKAHGGGLSCAGGARWGPASPTGARAPRVSTRLRPRTSPSYADGAAIANNGTAPEGGIWHSQFPTRFATSQ